MIKNSAEAGSEEEREREAGAKNPRKHGGRAENSPVMGNGSWSRLICSLVFKRGWTHVTRATHHNPGTVAVTW